jgi:putative peptidoglycan lipid II flippase
MAFTVLVMATMPLLMQALAPGFVGDAERFDLAIVLTRITFPYLLFVSLASLMAGVLNSLHRFAAAAAAPILLNLCMIAAVLLLARYTPTPAHALSWGVTVSGVAQFVWLSLQCVQAGVTLRLPRLRLSADVRRLLRRILPVALGAGIYQVNMVINTMLASLLPAGAISYLFYADRVTQLPLGIVGVAVGTALLPMLSRDLRGGRLEAAMATQNRAIELAMLLTVPASVALIALAEPVVIVLFERGAFSATDTAGTTAALAVYAAGVPAFVLVKALSPGFYAREDTATPVKVAGLCVVVNLLVNLLLMAPLAHVGIALGTTAAAWLNATLLAVGLSRRGHLTVDLRLRRRLPRTLLASLGMAACLVAGRWLLVEPLSGHGLAPILALAVLIGGGLIAFAVLAHLLGAASLAEVRTLLRRQPA